MPSLSRRPIDELDAFLEVPVPQPVIMEDLSKALALFGFVQPKQRVEEAGISYELLQVRHNLSLGRPTAPVYNQPCVDDEEFQNGEDMLDCDKDLEVDEETDEQYLAYASSLDPNHYKEQDHYRALGLGKLRYQASANQLRLAYRRKVLKFHPDKGSMRVVEENGKGAMKGRLEEIFACIQKAYEQLGVSEKQRRAYDSIDPKFDETIPEKSDVNGQNFFDVLGPVFERNARFSNNEPVPLMGDLHSTRDEVEHFYDFWFSFDSWREFSYLDAEDKSKGEDRFERREIEKINKTEREKLRKKDIKRISNLVDLAYERDPRVARFKEEDRKAKEELKEQRKREKLQKERERRQREEEEIRLFEERMKERREEEAKLELKAARELKLSAAAKQTNGESNVPSGSAWSPGELQLLVKAVNVYPPGTTDRWKAISQYVTLHGAPIGGKPRNEKETIKQAKLMKPTDPASAEATQIKESEQILEEIKPCSKENANKPWTSQQQKQLEGALKSISSSDPERWEKISACVEGKSKKECMRRYKELVELVKAKKSAKGGD